MTASPSRPARDSYSISNGRSRGVASRTDYDVFVVDAQGRAVAASAADNLGLQQPFELLGFTNTTAATQTVNIVVGKFAGAANPRLKFVLEGASRITGVEHNTSIGSDVVGPTIFGHNGTSTVGSTAAIPFSNSTTSEAFSSRGPVTLLFANTPSTTPLAAPQVLAKPDFAATDGVRTTFFAQLIGGVERFFGTSAAAPHAAAVGALLRQFDPGLPPAGIISTLHNTGRPVATNGTAQAVGGGYIDAAAALASVKPIPAAPSVTGAVSGNGRAHGELDGGADESCVPRDRVSGNAAARRRRAAIDRLQQRGDERSRDGADERLHLHVQGRRVQRERARTYVRGRRHDEDRCARHPDGGDGDARKRGRPSSSGRHPRATA